MDAALIAKVDDITEKKKQEEDQKERFEKKTKKEKEIYKAKNADRIDQNGLKSKRKTLLEIEREAHEAYQLLVSEHNRRVRSRTMQKLSTVNSLIKRNSGQSK